KKAHERQAVADQVLSLLIREIVERLQHHDLEFQDRIVGLATSVALALLGLRLGHALDVSAEVLPPHDLLDRFQRIAFGADRLKPALNIEKARLPHDSLAPSAHGPLRSASQIRSDLARRIFRGALYEEGCCTSDYEQDATHHAALLLGARDRRFVRRSSKVSAASSRTHPSQWPREQSWPSAS